MMNVNVSSPPTPAGLDAIHSSCRKLYDDQPNPLQVTALVKFWLGGPDPLDYISMYANPGDAACGIPPHWHYISFGLSDLHGDGRVHEISGPEGPSGFGFELTFRLKREDSDSSPPTWPAELMQGLARYVFQTGNILCPGDHVSWHVPLDNGESRLQHMLMAEDPQMSPVVSQCGKTQFVQIVGVCLEELKAAQQWNGPGVLELLMKHTVSGGMWLVTDMRRGESIFELDPSFQQAVEDGLHRDGSDLTGVSGSCSWEDVDGIVGVGNPTVDPQFTMLSQVTPTGLPAIPEASGRLPRVSQDVHDPSSESTDLPPVDVNYDTTAELIRTRTLDYVHLKFTVEAGSLLPLVFKGRLRHGRHFTFKSPADDLAITFVCDRISGSLADQKFPYAAHGPWLQVFISDEFLSTITEDMKDLNNPEELRLPREYLWEDQKLKITIIPEE